MHARSYPVPRNVLFASSTAMAALLLIAAAGGEEAPEEIPLEEARIYWEFNSTDDDLGVHVFLDGEDWRKIKIKNPNGKTIFEVKGKGPYKDLGLTELFYEGAEPALSEVPLEDLLELFPEGDYEFSGKYVEGEKVTGTWAFTHAVPAGPVVDSTVSAGPSVEISWELVTDSAPGFPDLPIDITGYQVIVGSFQVTLPDTATSVTVPPEYVASLGAGTHDFEVLAIEAGANQTISSDTFILP